MEGKRKVEEERDIERVRGEEEERESNFQQCVAVIGRRKDDRARDIIHVIHFVNLMTSKIHYTVH